MFWLIVGVCTLTEAPFLSSVRRTKKEREDSLHPGLREESSNEEGDRAMQLRVYETEIGSVGPAKMSMNTCFGEGAKTRGSGRTAEHRLLNHNRQDTREETETPECSEPGEAPGEEARPGSPNIFSS